ncbi:MAG: manganese efflux pump [Deltaproteobacteria bacterium]|nr:manganese efflux pump [Deltaproteobacteria bacterium]
MIYLTVFAIAAGLSMDALAVSISASICSTEVRVKHALKAAAWFGISQGLMPLGGYFLGAFFRNQIEVVDHWIAFFLLLIIGGKMIHEAFEEEKKECIDYFDTRTLFFLAIATSIDAFAAGLTLSIIDLSIWISALIITLVTAALCFAGVMTGRFLGFRFKHSMEIAGGIILILVGVKILLEHTGYI